MWSKRRCTRKTLIPYLSANRSKVLKKEVSHQCRKALYFASFSLCAGAVAAQNSTTTAPKLFGYVMIGMSIGAACHTVVISRFMRLLGSNHQESMCHWNNHDVYVASIIVAFPEAFTLGSIVSMGACVALYLHQSGAPTLQLTPDKHGAISVDVSELQAGNSPSFLPTPNTLPQWATMFTVCFFLLNAVQFAIVLHSLKWLCLTKHRQKNGVPTTSDSV
ncbi:hypothetical protein BC629DRAFT_756559 [Irpex lacteus]|nr:hypothetical protein BC629DRAFT_756559 [Irpex lacteus]